MRFMTIHSPGKTVPPHRAGVRGGGPVVAGLLAAGLVFAAACSSSAPEQAPAAAGAGVTAFEGAQIIVGDGSAPIENATILVRDSRIEQVGPSGQVQVPEGATRVNLAGKTVMPGILDAHVHLRSQSRDTLVEDLERRAYYGVVAAVSMGQDQGDIPYQVRTESMTAPNMARFETAGRGLTAPEPGRTEVPFWVTTPDEARAAVQDNAKRKVDIIKLWVDDRDNKYKKLTPELYGAAIEEAHKNGIRVTAHIYELTDAKGLLKAGLDAFAHGVRDRDIDEEFVKMWQARPQVILVPNLPNRGVAMDLSWVSDTVQPGQLEKLQAAAAKDDPEAQKLFGIQARNLAKLHAAGIKIAMGTDGNTPYGPHIEMADMVATGMPAHDVIVAATRNSAEVMGLTDLGTIAAGKSADFIVLDANPIDDITNTRRINAVYIRGTAVDRAGLRARFMAAKPTT
ncbi:MAG: amidohydrolase family protein [Acidobacteria bacterium]|nr:amidohydrolase family protein [Acidobacteriota bacterium]